MNKISMNDYSDHVKQYLAVIQPLGGYLLRGTGDRVPRDKDKPYNRITNHEQLERAIDCGTACFIDRPESWNGVGIDLDRHSAGVDGVKIFKELTGINPLSLPYYTETPGNGLHLRFHNDNNTKYVSAEIAPGTGIEVKQSALLVCPGSVTKKGIYIPHGNPADIPVMPESVKKILKVKNPCPDIRQTPRYVDYVGRSSSLPMTKIVDVLIRQGARPERGGRGVFTFQFSRYSRRQNYSPDETLNFLLNFFNGCYDESFTPSNIRATVRSAFNYQR